MRKALLALAVTAAGVAGSAVPAAAHAAPPSSFRSSAPAATVPLWPPYQPATQCSADFFDGDSRLGPATLPVVGRVGIEVAGYRRTGSLSPQAFLAKYWDPTANSGSGGWIYPPDNGYLRGADGKPIEWQQTLAPGQDIDRFGSEYGSFLAPALSPYWSRAIPPANLDGNPAAGCNYHDYRVIKAFPVDTGPVAPWFGQPGFGLQYQLDSTLIPGAPARLNVMWLVDNGYLQRIV